MHSTCTNFNAISDQVHYPNNCNKIDIIITQSCSTSSSSKSVSELSVLLKHWAAPGTNVHPCIFIPSSICRLLCQQSLLSYTGERWGHAGSGYRQSKQQREQGAKVQCWALDPEVAQCLNGLRVQSITCEFCLKTPKLRVVPVKYM